MSTITYTVHDRPGREDTSYTTRDRALVQTLLELLIEAGNPTLPAFLPKIGITVTACSSAGYAWKGDAP